MKFVCRRDNNYSASIRPFILRFNSQSIVKKITDKMRRVHRVRLFY